jgi:hypothetical protein
LIQITRDGFPTELVLPPSPAFPNGQRYGDDVTDQLLVQLVAGSVNAVSAALPNGLSAAPAIIGFGGVTAQSTLLFATSSAVPVPAGFVLMTSGALALVAFRRKRGHC